MGKALDYNHRMVEDEVSKPLRHYAITKTHFSNDFYFSVRLGLVDIAILCNRPNICCQHNLKCSLFSLTLNRPGFLQTGWGGGGRGEGEESAPSVIPV